MWGMCSRYIQYIQYNILIYVYVFFLSNEGQVKNAKMVQDDSAEMLSIGELITA